MEPNPKRKSPETRDFKELLGKKITSLVSLVSIILFLWTLSVGGYKGR